jgi:coenzyme F420 hydrogenase subunit beta
MLGVPVPRYRGLPMFRHWWSSLTARAKARTIIATVRRILGGRLRDRSSITPDLLTGEASR